MKQFLMEFIQSHAAHAHWIAFVGIVLAGLNLPISIDLVVMLSAFVAAKMVPENAMLFYVLISLGCLASASLAYWIGRLLGTSLSKKRVFNKIASPERMQKLHGFYSRHGLLTLIVGRFIPFGVRNCLFLSSGISKVSYRKFILRDLLATFIWSTVFFFGFFLLAKHFDAGDAALKNVQIVLFSVFLMTGIVFIWYKLKKGRNRPSNS